MPLRLAGIPSALAAAIVLLGSSGSAVPARAAGTDGAWHELVPPPRRWHDALYDPLRQRMVLVGGHENPVGVWTLTLGASPQWAFVPTSGRGTPPIEGGAWAYFESFYAAAAIYDPVRDRILVEGIDWTVPGGGEGTWQLSLATMTWSKLQVAGTPPPPRVGHSAIYDPVRDRMITFGNADTYSNDVWVLSLSGTPTWTHPLPAAPLPGPRGYHAAIYDPVRDRMVVFGGGKDWDGSSMTWNDVWVLSLGGAMAWTQLLPSGTLPASTELMGAVYDPVRDRMLITGGTGGVNAGTSGQTWSLDLAALQWQKLAPAGTSAPSSGSTAIYDAANDRVVTYGGDSEAALRALTLSPLSWTRLSPGYMAADPLYDAALVANPPYGALLSGGGDQNTDYAPAANNTLLTFYSFSSGSWAILDGTAPYSSRPPARIDHSAIMDPLRSTLIEFGGYDDAGTKNDVWSRPPGGPWTHLAPTGTPPSARAGHSAVLDPAADRMVVFGGNNGTSCLNDVWALALGAPQWTPLAPAGTPPSPRLDAAAVLDPASNRMILFGGYNGAIDAIGRHGTAYNDLWALSLGGAPAWTPLAPLGTPPPPAFDPIAVDDPDRSRVEVLTNAGVWALYLSDPPVWQKLDVANAVIGGIERGAAVYDPTHHRILELPTYSSSVWALDFADTPTAVEISLVQASVVRAHARVEWWTSSPASKATVQRSSPDGAWIERASVTTDASGRVAYEDAGVTPGARYGYRLALAEGDRAATGGEAWLTIPALELALRGAQPNPSVGPPRIAFSLPDAAPARLALYDVAGREIAAREVGGLGAGSHVVVLAPGVRLRAGLYLARLVSAGRTLTARIAVLR